MPKATRFVAIVLAVLSVLLAACSTTPQSSSRLEFEIVPDAKRVTLNTQPRWPLGTNAFAAGDEDMLVISHISSWSNTNHDATSDRVIERLWIGIPRDLALGDTLLLKTFPQKVTLDYDEGEVGDTLFRRPHNVLGKVTVIERSVDHVTVDVQVTVEPNRLPRWSVSQVIDVPVSATGVHAAAAPSHTGSAVAYARRVATEREDQALAAMLRDDAAKMLAAVDRHSTAMNPLIPVSNTDQSDVSIAFASHMPLVDPDHHVPSHPLQGRWTGSANGETLRAQFTRDGRYMLASGDHAETGIYRIKQGHVILRKQFDLAANSGAPLAVEGHEFTILAVDVAGRSLSLTGSGDASDFALARIGNSPVTTDDEPLLTSVPVKP